MTLVFEISDFIVLSCMLLILNTIGDAGERQQFAEKIFPRIFTVDYKVLVLSQDEVDTTLFSGLMITGSELSASEGSPKDAEFFRILKGFVDAGKPVLGICWGHQMIARYLGGDDFCKKAITPEFGFRKVKLLGNDPILEGISNPVIAQSHFDEVVKLKADWTHLASSNECRYNGIRFGDVPIWGFQFHPESYFEFGTDFFKRIHKDYPQTHEFYRDELTDKALLDQNIQIFRNFEKVLKSS